MEQTYAIELKNITKRFGKIVANDGINLKVKRGEILSLLGENGSGKTTLMNMISGIYFPDEGRILVDGKAVSIRSPKDSFDLGIGMIHQHFKLIDVMTAAENIILGLKGNAERFLRSVFVIQTLYILSVPDQDQNRIYLQVPEYLCAPFSYQELHFLLSQE